MTETAKSFLVIVAALLLACGFGMPLWAQDAGDEVVPLPELIQPDSEVPQGPMPDPVPLEQPPADAPFEWTYSRTNTNTAGNVSNTHQNYTSEDGNTYMRQHMVTNPSGQMTHTWERTRDGDSYALSREKNRVFRDGRTMEMTRTYSWDAESGTGTMSRTFEGPNGQSRSFDRPWSPDGELADVQPSFGPDGMGTLDGPRTLEAPERPERGMHNMWGLLGSTKKSKPDGNFWSKLNTFRHNEMSMAGPKPSPRRSGFTLGSTARHSVNAPRYGLAKKQAGQAQVQANKSKLARQLRPDTRPPQAASRPHPKTH
jgi:hypothetical protein